MSIGPAGDQHFVPLNMTTAERMLENPEPESPAEEEPETGENPPEDDSNEGENPAPAGPETANTLTGRAMRLGIAASHVGSFRAVYERLARVEKKRRAKAPDRETSPTEWGKWRDELVESHTMKVRGALNPLVDALAGSLRATLEKQTDLGEWSRRVADITQATALLWAASEQKPERPAEQLAECLLLLAESCNGDGKSDCGACESRSAGN